MIQHIHQSTTNSTGLAVISDLHSDIKRLKDLIVNVGSGYYLVIAGDSGIVWSGSKQENENLEIINNLASKKSIIVAIVDGNHENFDLLNSYPVTEWNGGKVHIIRNNIIHLMRGQIFTIGGKTLFAFGGAASQDRHLRGPGSWWPQEIPTVDEYIEAFNNLEHNNNTVDIIITHQAPRSILEQLGKKYDTSEENLICFLDTILKHISFKKWIFAHNHTDRIISPMVYALYRKTIYL